MSRLGKDFIRNYNAAVIDRVKQNEKSGIKSSSFYRQLRKLVLNQEQLQGEECGITDALANLRHIADELKQDFADLDRQAYQHYIAELQDAGELRNCCKCGRVFRDGLGVSDHNYETDKVYDYCSEECFLGH